MRACCARSKARAMSCGSRSWRRSGNTAWSGWKRAGNPGWFRSDTLPTSPASRRRYDLISTDRTRGASPRGWKPRRATCGRRWPGPSSTPTRRPGFGWRPISVSWLRRSQLTEGRDWLEQTLAMPGDAPAATRIDALYGVGSFARLQGDYHQAIAYGEEGLALARGIGDEIHTARSLYLLGLIAHYEGDRDRAKSFYDEALGLVRGAHDAHLEAMLLNNLGDVVVAQNDPLAAQGHYEAALAIWRERRDDWGIAMAHLNLGHLALRSGDAQRAGGLYGEGLTMSVELGDQAGIADYLNAIGRLAADLGQWSSAARLLSAATALYHSLGIEQFPDHRGEYEHAVAAARAGLGDEAFTATWDAGQVLPPEQAIAEALAVTGAPVSDAARLTP